MERIITDFYDKDDIKIITPEDNAQYFFAYYDMRATGNSAPHLTHRVPFLDRIPTAEDLAEIGYLQDGKFFKVAETTAWNFQQGAMLQYHPYLENTIYYNVCEDGEFKTVTHNFVTGEKSYTDRATACVSDDGRWGLAVNFGRIFAFRPGYGYVGFKDENANLNHPENDGIYLVDMQSGRSKLIANYRYLGAVAGFDPDKKILVNHISFNRTSDRFVALVRNFPVPGVMWSTSMVIGDLKGNCFTVIKNSYVSHYNWLNGNEIVAHCRPNGYKENNMFLIDVDARTFKMMDIEYFHGRPGGGDIHCNFSPDGNYIIGDGYPLDGYRHLIAYSVRTGEYRTLLKSKSYEEKARGDFRCDLHARFVWGGKAITYDSTHNDRRQIVQIPTDRLDF